MPRLTNKQVIGAIKKTGGLISLAAVQLGCSRQAIYVRAKKHPAVAQAIAAEREVFVDVCEAKLREKVNKGEAWAIQFGLRTLGADRGYSDRVEVEHSGVQDVRIHVVYGDDEQRDRPRLHRPA